MCESLTTEVITAMRDWAKDCVWRDVEEDGDIDALTDAEIVRGVDRHYDGGVEEFLRTCA